MKAWKNMEFDKLLVEIIKLFNIDTYMELGIRRGRTFNQIAPLVKRCIGVDLTMKDYIAHQSNIELYEMSTIQFSQIWKDQIDFLFIDADHKKESVLQDFNLFSKFVREGTGIIALHDTHPISKELLTDELCSNAWEAAWEIRTKDEYKRDFEIFTFPGPYAGMSLIRKSCKHLSWM